MLIHGYREEKTPWKNSLLFGRPPHENKTGRYIDYVAAQMQIAKNQPFKKLDRKFFISLAKAITEMENGAAAAQSLVPYSAYEKAFSMMGNISYIPSVEKKNE